MDWLSIRSRCASVSQSARCCGVLSRMTANVRRTSLRIPQARQTQLRQISSSGSPSSSRSRSGAVNIRDSDIAAALERRGATQLVATEYTLVPIVFVVPRNSNKYAARLSEAKALRSRFTDCESGLATVKSMREVVIRPQVLRLSSDMPPKISKIFDDTPVGHLTPPEVSQSGVETFAVCNKTQVRGESSEKREIKDELTSSQFEAESKKLLAELRKSSLIQYR